MRAHGISQYSYWAGYMKNKESIPRASSISKALPLAFANDLQHQHDYTADLFSMSTHFSKTGQLDSSIHYAQLVVHSNNPDQEAKHKLESLENLAYAYSKLGPNIAPRNTRLIIIC
jgi:hypothetical protein